MFSKRIIIKGFAIATISMACLHTFSCTPKGKNDIIRTRYVHKYGITVDKQDWNSRGQDGQIITTRNDGVIITETYEKGQKHGLTTYTFPHSFTIDTEENYSNGNLLYITKHFSSGVPSEKTEFQEDGFQLKTTWYHDGNPKSIELVQNEKIINAQYFNPNNELESKVENGKGYRINRNAYGEMICKETISDGIVSLATTFHSNGDPKIITPYNEQGHVHGIRKSYLTGGVPQLFEEWKEGIQEGTTVIFQNGLKYSEQPFVHGQKHGIEKIYKDGKEVVEEISWKNDLKHGPAKVYVENSVKTDWYFNGRRVSKIEFEQFGRG